MDSCFSLDLRTAGNLPGKVSYRRSLIVRVAAVAGIVCALGACGGVSTGSQSDSAAAGNSNQMPQLSVSPSVVSFGDRKVGTITSQVVTLDDPGLRSITVSQVTVSGNAFSVKEPSLPIVLMAGQSATLTVTFSPSLAGRATGSVSVSSNASNSSLAISLSGNGTTQLLSASPGSLTFGDVTVGTSSVLSVVLTNAGTDTVTVSQTTSTGTGFSVAGPSLPLTLTAGQNASFNVTFQPASAGSVTGNLSVLSNATNSPASTSLSATGVNKHSVSLSWVASASPSVSGYNIYRGAAAGGPYTKLNSSLVGSTAYTDNSVEAGQTYYYVTTAVNAGGQESKYSNQATVLVPSP